MVRYRFEITTFICLLLVLGTGFLLRKQLQDINQTRTELNNLTISKPSVIKKEKDIRFPLSVEETKYLLKGLFDKVNLRIRHNDKFVTEEITKKDKPSYVNLMDGLTRLSAMYNVSLRQMCLGQECQPYLKLVLDIYPKIQKKEKKHG